MLNLKHSCSSYAVSIYNLSLQIKAVSNSHVRSMTLPLTLCQTKTIYYMYDAVFKSYYQKQKLLQTRNYRYSSLHSCLLCIYLFT